MRARILLPLSVFILSGLLAKAADCGVNFDRSVKTTVDAATEYKAKNPNWGYPQVVLVHRGAQLRIGPDSQSLPLCVAATEFFSVVLSSKRYGLNYFLVQGCVRPSEWSVRFFLGAPDFLLHCMLAIGAGAHFEACGDARSTQLVNDFVAAFDPRQRPRPIHLG